MELRLNPPKQPEPEQPTTPGYAPGYARRQPERDHPLAGYIAVGLGLLSIFVSFVFVPPALIMSIVCMFKGQWLWAIGGIILAVIGVITSIFWVGLIGLGFLAQYLDFQAWLADFMDLFTIPDEGRDV